MTNPVGLYIDSFEHDNFETDKGEDISSMWTTERHSIDGQYVVRAKFEIPSNCLGKIKNKTTGRYLKHGSQLAESIWISANYTVSQPVSVTESVKSETQPIFAFIEGRHIKPTKISPDVVDSELRLEPFGDYLAKAKNPARNLKELIATFEDFSWVAYAADEGIGFL